MPPELAFALGSADWSLVGWLALLAGCLALDETALAQTWLSQPLPAAILAGLVCGEPMAGLALGLPLQAWLALRPPSFAAAVGAGPGVPGLLAGAALASCCLLAALGVVVSRLDWAREARRAARAVEVSSSSGSRSAGGVSRSGAAASRGGLRAPLMMATE